MTEFTFLGWTTRLRTIFQTLFWFSFRTTLAVCWPTAWRSACPACRTRSFVTTFSEFSSSCTWTWRSLTSLTFARWAVLSWLNFLLRTAQRFLSHFVVFHHSVWFSSTTLKLWAIYWRSLSKRITSWWPIRSALTCMRAPASSSCPLSFRTCGP